MKFWCMELSLFRQFNCYAIDFESGVNNGKWVTSGILNLFRIMAGNKQLYDIYSQINNV